MKSKKRQPRRSTKRIAAPIPAGARLIGIQQAADALGVSVWTVRAWAYQGKIASHKFAAAKGKGRLMIAPAELDRIVAESARPRICA